MRKRLAAWSIRSNRLVGHEASAHVAIRQSWRRRSTNRQRRARRGAPRSAPRALAGSRCRPTDGGATNTGEALLEVAPALGARQHRRHVERGQRLAPQRARPVAGRDPLGQPLRDGRLADARLADRRRIVLGAAAQALTTRRISSSRPTTGSSLPRRAAAVRSRERLGQRMERVFRAPAGDAARVPASVPFPGLVRPTAVRERAICHFGRTGGPAGLAICHFGRKAGDNRPVSCHFGRIPASSAVPRLPS